MKNLSKLLLLTLSIVFLAKCTPEQGDVDKDVRQDFLGNWKCVQTSNISGNSEFTVTIEKDAVNSSRILMYNFYKLGTGTSIYANVSTVAASALSIPSQSVKSNYISGSGTQVNTNKINFDYTVDDGNETEKITAVFTKL